MKYAMTFVEKTEKTIIVEVNSKDELAEARNECLDNASERIDFEKNFDSYDIYCEKIREIKE